MTDPSHILTGGSANTYSQPQPTTPSVTTGQPQEEQYHGQPLQVGQVIRTKYGEVGPISQIQAGGDRYVISYRPTGGSVTVTPQDIATINAAIPQDYANFNENPIAQKQTAMKEEYELKQKQANEQYILSREQAVVTAVNQFEASHPGAKITYTDTSKLDTEGKIYFTYKQPIAVIPSKAEKTVTPTLNPLSPGNQTTANIKVSTIKPPLTQQTTTIPKQEDYTPKIPSGSDIIYSALPPALKPVESFLAGWRTAVLPSSLVSMVKGETTPAEEYKKQMGLEFEKQSKPYPEQLLETGKVMAESIPGQILLAEAGGLVVTKVLPKAGVMVEAGGDLIIGKPKYISTTKGEGLLIQPKQGNIVAGEMKAESNIYTKGITTQPNSKVLVDSDIIAIDRKSGSLSYVTSVSKEGKPVSGVAVGRGVTVMENPEAGVSSLAAKSKIITKEESVVGESAKIGKVIYEIKDVPSEVLSKDTFLRQSGLMTTKKIATAGVETGGVSGGEYIMKTFTPTTNTPIQSSSVGLKSVDLVSSPIIEQESITKAAANIVTRDSGYHSVIETVSPKIAGPVYSIVGQQEAKKQPEVFETYGIQPQTSGTSKKTGSLTSMQSAEEINIGLDTTNTVKFINPQKQGTGINTIIGGLQGIGQSQSQGEKQAQQLGQMEMLEMATPQAMISNISHPTTPSSMPNIPFALPGFNRERGYRRFGSRGGFSRYSLKTHPIRTAGEQFKIGFKPIKGFNFGFTPKSAMPKTKRRMFWEKKSRRK